MNFSPATYFCFMNDNSKKKIAVNGCTDYYLNFFLQGKTDTIDFLEDNGPLRKGGVKTKSQAKKNLKG